jgi:hypothetical protein
MKLIVLHKNDGEKWSRIFYFETQGSPSEIPANLHSHFSPSGQISWHWTPAILKGLTEFQNEKS